MVEPAARELEFGNPDDVGEGNGGDHCRAWLKAIVEGKLNRRRGGENARRDRSNDLNLV